MFAKSFDEIINQPTVKDGSLKTGLALTRMARAGLVVEIEGRASINGTPVSLAAMTGGAMLPGFDNKYDITPEELIQLYAEEYIIQQQKNIAGIIASGGATAKKPAMPLTAGSVLSAQDYLAGNLKTAQLDNVAIYSSITGLLANPDKTTKAQLLEFVAGLSGLLLPEAVKAVYNEKVRKEAELSAQFAELTELGFSGIQPVADNTYSAMLAEISKEVISSALQGLTSKGYLLRDSQVNLADATIKVVFAKQSEQ